MAADIVRKRTEKILSSDNIKAAINADFKQLSEIAGYRQDGDLTAEQIKSLNKSKQKEKFQQMVSSSGASTQQHSPARTAEVTV